MFICSGEQNPSWRERHSPAPATRFQFEGVELRMAVQAERLRVSFSLTSFSVATELKKRLLFTVGALAVFRLLSFVPLPGIDPHALDNLFQ